MASEGIKVSTSQLSANSGTPRLAASTVRSSARPAAPLPLSAAPIRAPFNQYQGHADAAGQQPGERDGQRADRDVVDVGVEVCRPQQLFDVRADRGDELERR